MPDRFLRDGIIRSDRYNALTLDARDLFIRLMLIADDFGAYDGRDNVIAHAAYFHGRAEPLPMRELHEQGLIVRYTNAGRQFVALAQWGEQLRLKRLFPAPPINTNMPGVIVRGKFGRPIQWQNPADADAVSILIDVNGRAVMPQPPEWRRVNGDWSPLDSAPRVAPAQAQAQPGAQGLQAMPQSLPHVVVTPPSALPSSPAATTAAGAMPQRSTRTVTITPQEQKQEPEAVRPAATTGNGSNGSGKIELTEAGEWRGLSEAQRLRWQDMFPDLRVPEQLQRAGEWLLAHDEERTAYSARGELGEYLIRWLLREARGHQ